MKRLFGLYHFIRHKAARLKASYYDRRLGIVVKGEPFREDISYYKDMYQNQVSFYGRLERMVSYLKLNSEDIFIDLGCGEGRVVFFLALQNIKKVIGIEIDKGLIDSARRNLDNLKFHRSHIDLIQTDAAEYEFKEETVFFMFNPFGRKTFTQVRNHIRKSLIANPRNIRIVYYGPAYHSLLNDQEWLMLEGRIEEERCSIWRNQ